MHHGTVEARAHAIEDSGMTLLAVAQGDNSQASSIKWQRFHRENMEKMVILLGKMMILLGRSVFSSGKLWSYWVQPQQVATPSRGGCGRPVDPQVAISLYSTKTIRSIPWFMFRLKRWSQLTNHPVFLGLTSMCSCLITIFGASIAWFLLVKPPFVLLVSSSFGSSHYPMFCRGLVQAMLKLLQYGVHKDRGSEIGRFLTKIDKKMHLTNQRLFHCEMNDQNWPGQKKEIDQQTGISLEIRCLLHHPGQQSRVMIKDGRYHGYLKQWTPLDLNKNLILTILRQISGRMFDSFSIISSFYCWK